MTTEVKKSSRLIKFLKTKGLEEKFDFEVKKWNPKSFQNKKYNSIIGSFRFSTTLDGALFWQKFNDQFEEYEVNINIIPNSVPIENS